MATFSEALNHLKEGGFAKREVIKNDTVVVVHKKRLYQMAQSTGVRYPYAPKNGDLMSDDWVLIRAVSHKSRQAIDEQQKAQTDGSNY